ncbi:uncharacterized protein L969DRAFT_19103 [Mixia osmundae IAM 14324]|uniref:N-acetylglucosaminylphosphatidylinositol deacetylase n=1 Tax=Mixia osmundae (strain CBS 9802 / IAM 14324 / JCM 22182 / KY 12970) TaxID=764103 RepID=G7EA68_MIXOS|nr:uncharacterized protein L969DRAFT_19103 [Mixia osmundae IAM 14324]KEI37626.1 hypothetical protein L969DRAFT_19103 [Mixia osmundae IAM 14324]GAA99728.1 hypothetical protein E5Q_06431 [Mixia osmundae IAM 14324]
MRAFIPTLFYLADSVARASSLCTGGTVIIVAHPDDDLLFVSPDMLNDISSERCTTTVYATSGDNGEDAAYYLSREQGVETAWADAINSNSSSSGDWTTSQFTLSGLTVRKRTHTRSTGISKLFLRAFDGGFGGHGTTLSGDESLQCLYQSSCTSLGTVDNSNSFTLDSLQTFLAALIVQQKPAIVRTLDYRIAYGAGDHSDHATIARIVLASAALVPSSVPFKLIGYQGYPIANLNANLDTIETQEKTSVFYDYTPFDANECANATACAGRPETAWLARQYESGIPLSFPQPNSTSDPVVTTTQQAQAAATTTCAALAPSTYPAVSLAKAFTVLGVRMIVEPVSAAITDANIALNATASASSEDVCTGQKASSAIDGIVGGYQGAGNISNEWATLGGKANSWLQLTWTQPQTISRVQLFDRPNLKDWVTSGTLLFGDNSTVDVGALYNNGSTATEIRFTPRVSSTLRFSVLSVGNSTSDIGLSEIRVFSTTPGQFFTSAGNLALSAVATASSANAATRQLAKKAIDGVLSGYPTNPGAEWATIGGGVGSWLLLRWPKAVSVSSVTLFDRPNHNDQILAGQLIFSDNSTIPVTSLKNDGSATVFTFPSRNTTSLKFKVLQVSNTTSNVGLSEIQVN